MAVGLFVHTQVIIPNFICRNCTMHQLGGRYYVQRLTCARLWVKTGGVWVGYDTQWEFTRHLTVLIFSAVFTILTCSAVFSHRIQSSATDTPSAGPTPLSSAGVSPTPCWRLCKLGSWLACTNSGRFWMSLSSVNWLPLTDYWKRVLSLCCWPMAIFR